MVVTARKAAAEILINIEKKRSYGNLELKKTLGDYALSPREKGLVTELVYGVLRYRLTLDFALNGFLKKDISLLKPPLRAILRLGGYQVLYLDRIPDAAACNESVKLVKVYGFSGFAPLVNAVLRNLVRNKDALPWPRAGEDLKGYISITHSHPLWMVQRWLERMAPEEVEDLCRANNTPPVQSIRVNTLRVGVQELVEGLREEGFETRQGLLPETLRIVESRGSLAAARAFQSGFFSIQGEVSSLAARLLDPEPGHLVVDMCSAPGGKTTHVAQLMQDQGRIIAGDFYPHRKELVQAAARRLGIKNIEARVWDARSLPRDLWGKAHRVLLDAPCSGLGVIRRKPDLKWQREAADFGPLSALQKEMLFQGAKLLKPGGLILYSVCTNEPEETGTVLTYFLKENPGFGVMPLLEKLPGGMVAQRQGPGIQIYPHCNDTDGFYFALLGRKP